MFGSNESELEIFTHKFVMHPLPIFARQFRNDPVAWQSGAHPSDNFAPVLTYADAIHADDREVIVAPVLAYEVFCRLCDRLNVIANGFDDATTGVLSGLIGASKIFGLSYEEMLEATNLAIASNTSLGQTRMGEVSMWKSCALANAGFLESPIVLMLIVFTFLFLLRNIFRSLRPTKASWEKALESGK